MLLTEMDTPQIRERLSEANPHVELELTRLARLLAVLATGSRIEDSEPQLQAAIAQGYVRRSFKCLQLANHMLRPTTETIETLLLLSNELLNEHQPNLAWTVIGTASRLSQLIDSPYLSQNNGQFTDQVDGRAQAEYIFPSSRSRRTYAHNLSSRVAIMNTALHDAIISAIVSRSTPTNFITLLPYAEEAQYLNPDITTVLVALYASIPDATRPTQLSPERWGSASSASSDALTQYHLRLDTLTHRFRLADIAACKSIRDRYEYYTFRLHRAFVTALVARAALPDRSLALDAQDGPADRALERAHLDALAAFLDFSSISNLPVRTWWMVHFVLDAAAELCSVAQAPESQLVTTLLPRLSQVMEGGVGVLSRRHQEAVGLVARVGREVGELEGERSVARRPREDVQREVMECRGLLGDGEGHVRGEEGSAVRMGRGRRGEG